MDKKLQREILEYIKQSKEISREQVLNVFSDKDFEKRSTIQENINLLLDSGKIHIVGSAETIALTNNGYDEFNPWYKNINWKKNIKQAFIYALIYLLGLFSGEIKIFIVNFIKDKL